MFFVIKAEVRNSNIEKFEFNASKKMYGGKQIAKGDMIFIFASENEGGPDLIAGGVVEGYSSVGRASRSQ
jgi:hypothetical protein